MTQIRQTLSITDDDGKTLTLILNPATNSVALEASAAGTYTVDEATWALIKNAVDGGFQDTEPDPA